VGIHLPDVVSLEVTKNYSIVRPRPEFIPVSRIYFGIAFAVTAKPFFHWVGRMGGASGQPAP